MMEEMVKIKKEKQSRDVTCCSDDNYYPYGTSISIDDDLVDELNAGNLVVGDIIEIKAHAFVDSKSESSNKEGSNKSIRLQLTSMNIERKDDDRIKQMYGSD